MRDCIRVGLRKASLAFVFATLPVALGAQNAKPPESTQDQVPPLSTNYWPKFVVGFGTSILVHELGHIVTSYALGAHPSFGFDELRPTIYSGISVSAKPHQQFLFSVSGLAVQNLLDEGILDVPHRRGAAFERGLLAGGIGTTVFYLTIGRTGSVSDVEFIARTHAMTKTQATVLFGSIVTMHTIRIVKNPRYANFFARPRGDGGLDFGASVRLR